MEQEREATDGKVGRQGEGELTARACMRVRTDPVTRCVYSTDNATPAQPTYTATQVLPYGSGSELPKSASRRSA